MKHRFNFLLFCIALLLLNSNCQKEHDNPNGNNKIELGSSTIDSILYYDAYISAQLINTGSNKISSHGFCWSTQPTPDITKDKIDLGSISSATSFSTAISNLQPNQKYYLRAFATISSGTIYGPQHEFTTLKTGLPAVNTDSISDITYTTAKCKGIIQSDSGLVVTKRGICWSLTPDPTISSNSDTLGKGLGNFEIKLEALNPATAYYVRAFAVNDSGTSYGIEKSFTTVALALPTLTTNQILNITNTSAVSGGNITSDGGSSITERGICWSTSPNPSIFDFYASSGTGLGNFSIPLTSLVENTLYYLRSYAINNIGTSYGNELSFRTYTLPSVSTTLASNITQTTATCGGDIMSDGGANITSRGVCWATTPNPTITNNKTSDGNGTGQFISNLTGLAPNTTFYVRAYATNSVGTAYGNQESLKTISFATGQNYGGGIIFYIDETGVHGLISALTDQNTGAIWCTLGVAVGTFSAIGTGQINTTAIVNTCNQPNTAAIICENLILNGYSDWYLPSKDELYQLFIQRDVIGSFSNTVYWSSTEVNNSNNFAWYLNFDNGDQSSGGKYGTYSVRAIRSF